MGRRRSTSPWPRIRSSARPTFRRLHGAFVGAAPVPVALLDAWLRKGVALRQGYGMTETGPLVLNLDAADAARKAGSAGKPVMHVEVRVAADAEGGRDAAPGEVGELWVRGPAVAPGYWNRPEAARGAFAEGGWLRTGDAVRVDEEGFFFIVDRWKDMYISGGENVYPAEVERVLHRHPAVAEAAVIGVPDARWGELGRAVVVPEPGAAAAPSEAELLAHCAAALARYKVPKLGGVRRCAAPQRGREGPQAYAATAVRGRRGLRRGRLRVRLARRRRLRPRAGARRVRRWRCAPRRARGRSAAPARPSGRTRRPSRRCRGGGR